MTICTQKNSILFASSYTDLTSEVHTQSFNPRVQSTLKMFVGIQEHIIAKAHE